MSYGLYLSASGVLANLYRQDVFANNLANEATVGFKVDTPMVRQRPPEVTEGGFFPGDSNALLDRLGGGVFAGPQEIRWAPGEPVAGGPLDIYLNKPNHFLVVGSPTDPAAQRLTRYGSFNLNRRSQLVTANDGTLVLDVNDQPIVATGAGEVSITARGEVIQGVDRQVIGRLKIVAVDPLDQLAKDGANRFRVKGDIQQVATPVEDATVTPRHLEASGTNPIETLMNIVNATKAVTGNGNMIRYHDLMMDRAVNTLGRVVA